MIKLLSENKRAIVPIFLTVLITFFGQNFAYSNNAPVFTDGTSATRTIAENTAAGVNIGAPIAATDADNDVLIYGLHSVVGQDAAAFSIVSTTGQLQTKAALNYEAKNTYVFAVFAQDLKGSRTGISVTINLTNVNEKPIFAKDRVTLTVAENTAADTNIGAPFQATDPDSGDTLTYSLKRGDKDAFSIDPNTGQLRTKAALDYETKQTYSDLAVRVTDSAGLTGAALVTISVTDVPENNAPVFTDGSSTTRTIAENTAAGQNIGTPIAATDADNDTLIYTLNGDPDASAFSIISTSGQLQTNAALDYETKSSYAVTVSVSDNKGGSDSISVTIKLTDVTEPSITSLLSDRTPQVRDAIVAAVPGVNNANDVTKAHLARITNLNLRAKGISALKAGDFAGLSSLREIELTGNQLRTPPTDIFSGLSSLRVIYLNLNQLTSLPEKLFEGLTSLEHLYLNNNQLTSLPEKLFNGLVALRQINSHTNQLTSLPPEVFSGLSSLLELFLHNNQLTEVPAGVFSGLPLIRLSLHGNRLTDLPAGVFSGLPTLTSLLLNNNQLSTLPTGAFRGLTLSMRLWLHGNTVDPLPLVVSLEKVGANGFKAVISAGAPFGITLPLSVANGSISGGATTVMIPQGSLESGTLSVTRTPGTTAAVSVSIGTLPGLPANHQGYRPTKSATLPLTVISPSANTAPVFTEGTSATRTIAENTSSGENIGSAVAATDADNDTLTYTLGGTDAASFTIVSTTGQLKTSGALDYETQSSYSVTVTAADAGALSATTTVSITVTDVNDAPTFIEGDSATRNIAENTAANTNIGDAVTATDPDRIPDPVNAGQFLPKDTLTYTLGGTDAASFSIVSTTGQLQTKAPLDYETKPTYSVTVTATDDGSGTLTDEITITIDVTDINENNAPTFTDGTSTTRAVAENTAANTNIGDAVAATDADGDTLSYTLAGTDAGSFSIVSTTGQLKTSAALNYETQSSYSVTISVSDSNGGSDNIDVTIDVSNVNEAPTFTEGETATRTIAENTAAGENIGDAVTATDVDANTTLVYTLSGTDAGSFSIVSTTGQLQTNAALDYETKTSYSVTIGVSDGSLTDTITVTITVTDVDETPANNAPIFTDGTSTTRTVAENTAANTNIGTAVAATDADGNTLDYALGGTDAASFSIVSTTGQLQTNAALDYETKNSYSVSVSVSDGNGGSDSIPVTIDITDVNEKPAFAPGRVTRTIAENTAAGTNIGDPITATDPDSGDTLTYSLQRGDKDAFRIDPNTGQLRIHAALDYETKNAYTALAVRVNDSTGLIGATRVTINVSNVNEAPTFTEGSSATRTVAETTDAGVNIGTAFTATDVDANTTLDYSLGGPDAAAFSIVNTSGQLQTNAALDYETKNAYAVTITVSDDSLTDTIDVTINVTDVNEPGNDPPTFTEGSSTTRAVAENTVSGTNIGTAVAATDSDTGDVLTYTLGGTDASAFRIVRTTGQLQTKAALDYETTTSYSVNVSVSDGNGGSDSITVTIDVTNVTEPPSPPVSGRTAQVRDAIVAAAGVSSADAVTEAHLAAITSLNLARKSISSLKTGDFNGLTPLDLNLDTNSISDISALANLTALDYLSLHDNSISDISALANLTALTTLDLSYNSISDISALENLTALTTLHLSYNSISDVSALENLTALKYLYLDNNSISNVSALENLTSLRALYLNNNSISDYAPLRRLKAAIAVIAGHPGLTLDITIPAVPNNNAPTFTDGTSTTRSIAENTAAGTNIDGLVSATDADTGDTLTYYLDGTDAAAFSIVKTSGQLQTSAALDYETKASYTVTVAVSDGKGGTDSITVTINVADIAAAAPSVKLPPVVPMNTALLTNFPNPFNPETWIPYQLAEPAEVTLTIYDVRGVVVRRLELGHQLAGMYHSRSRAIHWDGRNAFGEKVASGLYFYTLKAGDFTATRKLLIRK